MTLHPVAFSAHHAYSDTSVRPMRSSNTTVVALRPRLHDNASEKTSGSTPAAKKRVCVEPEEVGSISMRT